MDCKLAGKLPGKMEMTNSVYDTRGLLPTIRVFSDGGNKEVKLLIDERDVKRRAKAQEV